jgi:hypothetical protein
LPGRRRSRRAAASKQPFDGWTGQQGTAAMDDITSDLNERLSASCRETLQQLDDIEAKLAGLHAALERGSGPAGETRRPEAARVELAAVADMTLGLSVAERWTNI